MIESDESSFSADLDPDTVKKRVSVHACRKGKRHQRDVFKSYLTEGATFSGAMDIPAMNPVTATPMGLIPFSVAVQQSCTDYDCFVDFYEDDCAIERFWNSPYRYIDRLARFAGTISPDYSTCRDFPVAMKAWNIYRNQSLGSFMQKSGLNCVPNVRCEPDKPWMLDGTPRGGTIAIGARSCVKRPDDRQCFKEAVRYAVDTLQPSSIIWYGSTEFGVADYVLSKEIPLLVYPARFRRQG